MPKFDMADELVRQWNAAQYTAYSEDNIKEFIRKIPIQLEAEIGQEQYDEATQRLGELLLMYKNQDASQYVDFYLQGQAKPDSDRLDAIRALTRQLDSNVDPTCLRIP